VSEALQKHSRIPRKYQSHATNRKPSLRLAAPGKPIPADKREAITEDAKTQILNGMSIDQIAAKHGVSHYTLSLWLHALGDEYEQIRKAWIDGMLIESEQLLKEADDPLGLARARELQRRAQWYAERRDRARYGEQRDINVNVNLDLGDRLRRARERVIDVSTPQKEALSASFQAVDENGG
jgi:hypothetical protein